jgi:2-polyprenyl-3-methyl-5-hydroxy-6-metoxy-1,4-benzoquinol methylase
VTPRLVTQPGGWQTVDPKPDAAELKAFYAAEYFQNAHGTYRPDYSETEVAHRNLLARVMLAGITRSRPRGAIDRLLDIGCGEGWLMAAALAEGYDVQGLDFSDDGIRRLHPHLAPRARFGDAFEGLDALIEAGHRVDVCTLEHVLEHVLDPEGLLARLPRLLNPGGVVAITVPNDFSRLQNQALATGAIDRPFWVAPPQHLNYFNTETLPPLMQHLGFEVRCAFASFPIDWFLLHPGSNYIADPANGKAAHRARMNLDLMLAEAGMEAYLNLAQALFACGAGRSITVIAGLA